MVGRVKLTMKVALEGNYYAEKPDSLGSKWMVGLNLTPVLSNMIAKWLGGN
jgi:hypothetical protein